MCKYPRFPDYFKSELMETFSQLLKKRHKAFPDYFKSELMETSNALKSKPPHRLSRLLQIGINGNL